MTKPSIKNEQEYAAALEALERLLDAEPGTPEGEKFEALAKWSKSMMILIILLNIALSAFIN